MILAEDWIWLENSVNYMINYSIIVHSYKEWQAITIEQTNWYLKSK